MKEVKVLVVEGEKKELEEMLQKEYNTLKAISGESVIEMVKEEEPDLMILDMDLSGIDGMEILRRLRTLNLNLSVVAISAMETVEAAVETMKLGTCNYLTKPLNPEGLRMAVKKELCRSKGDREKKSARANCPDLQILIDEVKERMLEREASLEEAKNSFEKRLVLCDISF